MDGWYSKIFTHLSWLASIHINMEVSIVMGVPPNKSKWMVFKGKPHLEMDDFRGTPISGNHHIYIYIHIYIYVYIYMYIYIYICTHLGIWYIATSRMNPPSKYVNLGKWWFHIELTCLDVGKNPLVLKHSNERSLAMDNQLR